jgi:hypothetical protein
VPWHGPPPWVVRQDRSTSGSLSTRSVEQPIVKGPTAAARISSRRLCERTMKRFPILPAVI